MVMLRILASSHAAASNLRLPRTSEEGLQRLQIFSHVLLRPWRGERCCGRCKRGGGGRLGPQLLLLNSWDVLRAQPQKFESQALRI